LRTALFMTCRISGAANSHQVNGDADKEQHQRHPARSAHNPNMRPPMTISSPCNV
jgi:hypothetical protein